MGVARRAEGAAGPSPDGQIFLKKKVMFSRNLVFISKKVGF